MWLAFFFFLYACMGYTYTMVCVWWSLETSCYQRQYVQWRTRFEDGVN